MCCFCQIPEIRSVCHLWVWPLSLVNAFGHLCCCQELHFQFHSKVNAMVVSMNQALRLSPVSSSQCHEQRTSGFCVLPCLSPAPRYFCSAGWTYSHSNNFDGGNYCIFPCLSYLTMQKFIYNLDTESVLGEFSSRALTDISIIMSPFLIRTVFMYCWCKSWQSSFF